MKKSGYENLDVRVADAAIIKRYAHRRGITIVDAVHCMARLLDQALKSKRPLTAEEFADLIAPELAMDAKGGAKPCGGENASGKMRQGQLLSQEYDFNAGKVKTTYWSEKP